MSLFMDNKYHRWYYAIIANAQARTISGYTENHHIIPESLGGSNAKSNKVRLTAKEHFICHRLLPKMTDGLNKKKMTFALKRMLSGNKHQIRYKVTARTFETIKKLAAEVNPFNDPEWQRQNGLKQRGKVVSAETRKKMIANWTDERKQLQSERSRKKMVGKIPWNKGKKCPQLSGENNSFYGKKHSQEFKEKRSKELKGQKPTWVGKKKTCPHCNRDICVSNYTRYHGENCKLAT